MVKKIETIYWMKKTVQNFWRFHKIGINETLEVFPFFFFCKNLYLNDKAIFPIVLHTKLRDEWTAIYGRKLGKSEKNRKSWWCETNRKCVRFPGQILQIQNNNPCRMGRIRNYSANEKKIFINNMSCVRVSETNKPKSKPTKIMPISWVQCLHSEIIQ